MIELTAVVTGGTRGIGLSLAECLARRGASVAVTYRSDDCAAENARRAITPQLAAGRRLLALRGDAGDASAVAAQHREIRQALGPVNVLINNAGVMPPAAFEALSARDWDETLRINLSSAFYWCREVIPGMKALGFGRIVNIASIAARGGGVIGPHYAASKAGMLGLTRYGARELGPFGITLNAIAPAFIEEAGVFAGISEERREALASKTVVGRIGRVGDVVRAFEYLLESPFVTGVCLDVNGGAFMI
ncbi:MAG: SDR family oxidoreductase [Desulfobacterales bacterium]|jgi:3-oxoacyl-[acyl-carrier protein] reductase|nr:SDR family oxidoreductase [Desulfobacterales bacterium]